MTIVTVECPHCNQLIEVDVDVEMVSATKTVVPFKPVVEKPFIMYIDGGCQGNGAQDAKAYGSVKIGSGMLRLKFPEAHTNNEAEYLTLIAALKVLANLGVVDAEIRTDSLLMVNQVAGDWKIKEPRLRELYAEVMRITKENNLHPTLVWVPREEIVKVLGH